MSCNNTIADTLEDNIGRLCTVFTNTGGNAGSGFTGVVADVNDSTCRLITSIPSVTPNPLCRHSNCRCNGNNGNSGNLFGTSVTIPISKINCVATTEV